jgi:cbb3-type cytochrome oxidase subunit 3
MSLIFATQLTAIATAVLAVFAIVTAAFAILAFRKQSREVSDQASMLEVQSGQLAEQRKVNAEQIRVLAIQAAELRESLEERKREAAERRRAQAGRVFVSAEPNPKISDPVNAIALRAENTSQQPIYDLTFMWREGTGEWSGPEYRFPFPVLMPGEQKGFDTVFEPSLPYQDFLKDTSRLAAAVIFRDAAGVRWRLRSDGQLDEEPVSK